MQPNSLATSDFIGFLYICSIRLESIFFILNAQMDVHKVNCILDVIVFYEAILRASTWNKWRHGYRVSPFSTAFTEETLTKDGEPYHFVIT